MIRYQHKKPNWYLLSDAGIIEEGREELRRDEALKRMYEKKFNAVYGLGLINIINRPTRDVTELRKGEELPGRKKIFRIIKMEMPKGEHIRDSNQGSDFLPLLARCV